MTTTIRLLSRRDMLAMTLLCSLILTAGAERIAPARATAGRKAIAVSIHGVNHTAEPVSFVLTDPANKGNRGGGGIINAFSAGGTMCCYALPARWRPGVKIEVVQTYWLPERADETIPEVKKKYVLEVPRYADGKAGELWVTRGPGGAVSIVSTNLQPDHPRYPGTIKGWPVPDAAHQRVIQDRYIRDAEQTADLYLQLLAEIKQDPTEHLQESWDLKQEVNPESLKPFTGPTDPAYLAMLRKKYTEHLARAQKELKAMKSVRP